ncbi:UDP-N-acetylglucosamine 1-carboxyvinyltransferase [Natranaerobius thermophilus]|uniref:UDP-N-acetylglucosamine 1-carboxyvinyltransferase n=1 Tax=Natranaerobius thermophilus (strain ATCC BAA-1301 / DSM 18059 / JW/NM-WN-LF) TaxID=457570 RepID=B2A3F8_NATTJ|nr:UDP-N-acetylglucosamine 1-carboxyvinyltransferase [Natranaerobius thermophilus]ACB86387.1 UDP-N-acetylglucosamine 1-carboxyvinyltransferase [Natranaerobius thermophilus JW/NM-WN-LF]
MDKINVVGGNKLTGKVRINGAKNASLPIMAASLLATEPVKINEVPPLKDVGTMCEVLSHLGCEVRDSLPGEVTVNPTNVKNIEAPYHLMRKMRASFLVMGPLLAKQGRARISLPGGCAIGSRPIDLHLKGFSSLGADINFGHGYVEAEAKGLQGNRIYLDFPSVGATENIMMAATMAKGTTVIESAAEEPEIVDLANFLNQMGAKIIGAGTDTIKIEGVDELKGTDHTVIPDRIEAGTFMAAAAITGGEVLVENVISDHIRPVIRKMEEMGVEITEEASGLFVKSYDELAPIKLKTMPFPGFPTDMQPQMMALMTKIIGESSVTETVFENRFKHVDELLRMNADISIDGRTAQVKGGKMLTGAPVKASDLRAGASLILAGLISDGKTEISDIHHIERGYYNMVERLQDLGANIWRNEEFLKEAVNNS